MSVSAALPQWFCLGLAESSSVGEEEYEMEIDEGNWDTLAFWS
jgi:hypothetical protein